jgi:hypothetical protein
MQGEDVLLPDFLCFAIRKLKLDPVTGTQDKCRLLFVKDETAFHFGYCFLSRVDIKRIPISAKPVSI